MTAVWDIEVSWRGTKEHCRSGENTVCHCEEEKAIFPAVYDRQCQVWRTQRAPRCFLPSIPPIPSLFPRPHLDFADKNKANQLRYILHYVLFLLVLLDALHAAPQETSAMPYSILTYRCTFSPSLKSDRCESCDDKPRKHTHTLFGQHWPRRHHPCHLELLEATNPTMK